MVWWWSTAAFAGTCPDVEGQATAAWVAFDDAELEQSLRAVERAVEGLDCTDKVVSTERILELRWLEALIALGRGERERAERAVDAALVIDAERRPPVRLGPELAALFDQRKAVATSAFYLVSVQREGAEVWVDGRRVAAGAPVRVLQGRHLLQWRDPAGFTSDWSDVTADVTLRIRPIPGAAVTAPERRGAGAIYAAGGVLTAAGLGLVGVGYVEERAFQEKAYDADRYGECVRTADCYAVERENAIRSDAFRTRAMYLSGYVLSAVGVGVVGSQWLFDLTAAPGGGHVHVGYRW